MNFPARRFRPAQIRGTAQGSAGLLHVERGEQPGAALGERLYFAFLDGHRAYMGALKLLYLRALSMPAGPAAKAD